MGWLSEYISIIRPYDCAKHMMRPVVTVVAWSVCLSACLSVCLSVCLFVSRVCEPYKTIVETMATSFRIGLGLKLEGSKEPCITCGPDPLTIRGTFGRGLITHCVLSFLELLIMSRYLSLRPKSTECDQSRAV